MGSIIDNTNQKRDFDDLIRIINAYNKPECKIKQLTKVYNQPLFLTIKKTYMENGKKVIKKHQAIVPFELENYVQFLNGNNKNLTKEQVMDDFAILPEFFLEFAQIKDYVGLADKMHKKRGDKGGRKFGF